MKHYILLVIPMLVLTACAAAPEEPAATEPSYPEPERFEEITPLPYPYPGPDTGQQPAPEPQADAALLILRQALAGQLGISVKEVTVLKQEEMMWSDGCLGLAQPGEMCTQAIVPGYLVVLATPKGEFEYHTDKSMLLYRLATPILGGIDIIVLDALVIWQRTGGIAGICEKLTIYKNGEFVMEDCRNTKILSEGKLLSADWESIQQKSASIAPHEWKFTPPPGSADMFIDEYSWFGNGTKVLDMPDQELLNEYLAELAARLKTQPPDVDVIR